MSYGALGAIVAAVGIVIPFHKYQNIVSIALGLTLLGIAFGGITKVEIPVLQKSARALTGVLKNLFSVQLAKKNRFSVVILGALNGLLPCGLTLIALTWCITLKGPLDGFYFMLIFGAGTLPVMLGLTGIIPWLLSKFKLSITMFTTAMLILSGCLLIARVFMIHVPHTSASESGIMEVILCR